MQQSTVDHHCRYIRESVNRGETFLVTCVNFLANSDNPITAAEWRWIGQQCVMSGHLTVNDKNQFEVKQSQPRTNQENPATTTA